MMFDLRDVVSASALGAAVLETVAILIADLATGEIVHATRTAELLFGCEVRGKMKGMCVDALVPVEARDAHRAHRAAYANRPRSRPMGAGQELRGLHRDGHTFPVDVGLSSAVIEGRDCAIAIILLRNQPACSSGSAD